MTFWKKQTIGTQNTSIISKNGHEGENWLQNSGRRMFGEWWNYFACYGGDRHTSQSIHQTHKECTPQKVNFTVSGFFFFNLSDWQKQEDFTQYELYTMANTFTILLLCDISCCSVTKLCPALCNPHGLQHARPLCPSPSPGVCPSLCPLNQWCHPSISSSVILFFSFLHVT